MFGLLRGFYVQPMENAYGEMIAMFVVWTALMLLLGKRARKTVAAVCCVAAVSAVVYFTLMHRHNAETGLYLKPFVLWEMAHSDIEIYRALQMNVFLFVPFGLSLPFALPEKMKHKVIPTVIAGLMISSAVEACQYFFGLGRCEIDDVMMNTLGALAGSCSYLIYLLIRRINRRKHER